MSTFFFPEVFDSVLLKPIKTSMGELPSPEGSRSAIKKKVFDHITEKTSAHLCILHSLGGSQELSVLCSLLLQKQSQKPDPKIFMIRMTEKQKSALVSNSAKPGAAHRVMKRPSFLANCKACF